MHEHSIHDLYAIGGKDYHRKVLVDRPSVYIEHKGRLYLLTQRAECIYDVINQQSFSTMEEAEVYIAAGFDIPPHPRSVIWEVAVFLYRHGGATLICTECSHHEWASFEVTIGGTFYELYVTHHDNNVVVVQPKEDKEYIIDLKNKTTKEIVQTLSDYML